jgi:hypothetical protein
MSCAATGGPTHELSVAVVVSHHAAEAEAEWLSCRAGGQPPAEHNNKKRRHWEGGRGGGRGPKGAKGVCET